MKRLKLFLILGMIAGLYLITTGDRVSAAGDYVLFIQNNNHQETLYLAKEDGSALQTIISGNEVMPYKIGQHLLVFSNHQLFEYNLAQQNLKLLSTFNKDEKFGYAFSMKPAGPDQAVVITGDAYGSMQWYILEFSDGSLRKIKSPSDSLPSGTPNFNSPDGNGEAVIKSISFGSRFDLKINEKTAGKSQTLWTLPKDMTVLPDIPVWAPNSRAVAFYGKKLSDKDTLNGSYSLYIFNLDQKELVLVQEQVLSISGYEKPEMGEFRPDWSGDSKYLIVEYQPFGLPTESSVLKYELDSAKKVFLNDSHGEKQYPAWSPSGARMLFISSREGKGCQLYLMDANGMNETRLSPADGVTELAEWQQF